MKIIHDRANCIGCGACVAICQNYWKMAEDNKSNLIGGKINLVGNYELEIEESSCNKEAADSCPVNVIRIEK